MMALFVCWLYVLFGGQCELSLDVLVLYQVLASPVFQVKRLLFDKHRCAQITWQVIEQCR